MGRKKNWSNPCKCLIPIKNLLQDPRKHIVAGFFGSKICLSHQVLAMVPCFDASQHFWCRLGDSQLQSAWEKLPSRKCWGAASKLWKRLHFPWRMSVELWGLYRPLVRFVIGLFRSVWSYLQYEINAKHSEMIFMFFLLLAKNFKGCSIVPKDQLKDSFEGVK